ncbi:MAG: hypothetical protein KatS3mg043_1140 [Rhodothermaceae bacterium]|uniref:hypothetical protein n=1 Tax=Rhodocaloribacter litoris TaxID=2558931 RepID=UPI001E6338A2|nr:hypothetical protein [Rhodocaloribacter litoris]GIV60051.1 MAG: hypothetical protein KatS3mg043_1140 [Rhodothermaceae bacterium]
MPTPAEGYVLHSYGAARYLRHVVASVVTLRRHDTTRPVALYCTPEHRDLLVRHGLDTLFAHLGDLPEAHRSIVGFKHHLERFMPFERTLFVDADMVWCRNPDPLWQQLAAFPFTATGLPRADFYFGGPKGLGVIVDFLLNRRDRTLRRFGLTHLPRVQAGMIYSRDPELTARVCETARDFLARRAETHFRSRLDEGRSEESCEWSMAMAMSRLHLPVFLWHQGYNSPQLDFVGDFVACDPDFEQVVCRYYSDRFVHSLRFMPNVRLRDLLMAVCTRIPGRGDYMDVTPFALHFGWIHQKQPFYDFAERTWAQLTQRPVAVGEEA